MTQATTGNRINVLPVPPTIPADATVISPMALALTIMGLEASHPKGSLLSFSAEFDMLGVNPKGQLTKMNKRGNPFVGNGPLTKTSTSKATVRFDYAKKVESRGGESSGKGSWSQVVLIDGKPSALSVHKGDIETYLPEGLKDGINQRRAVVKDGALTFTTDSPRFYLRYEYVRQGKQEDRADKTLQSKSEYTHKGQPIDKSKVEPHLKARSERTDGTDMQVVSLGNLTDLAINGRRYVIN